MSLERGDKCFENQGKVMGNPWNSSGKVRKNCAKNRVFSISQDFALQIKGTRNFYEESCQAKH